MSGMSERQFIWKREREKESDSESEKEGVSEREREMGVCASVWMGERDQGERERWNVEGKVRINKMRIFSVCMFVYKKREKKLRKLYSVNLIH